MADVCTQGVDTGFVALGYAKIALLGVVQGLTELLPVSSTAHMRLVPALLGWQDPGSAFSAAMQLAALAAIISYFWSDVRYVAFGSVDAIRQRDWRSPAIRLAIAIVIATIPIGIAGLLLSSSLNACGTSLRSLWVIGIACLVMGLLLAAAELYSRHRKDMEQMTLLDALFVGITQVGALIPGVSRSGSTLTGALFLGLKRDEAARFSFLLGLPAIALAGLKELLTLYKAHIPMEAWSVLIVGLIVGCISSFVAIWGLMRFLERFSTWPFVIYRVVLGVVILFGVFALGWS
ncbi:undecaprenyl-diphosphate phosphatase [Agrobacterium rhizogenes]|uniref:Undecaprenyl-diphosphatase n=2 Tax=Rhizobium rhizogenes TaxID=359 RepID=B9JK70_RHIR8|nr:MULTISPECIES: undecaprenyl-diphosphate phosphatase [Rhizobium]ACM30312.1 undecaprenol kinase [Rhizobium rhizogenes K84]OCJ01886.1 undecaprenyl-diphosphatase UppP [Agrobacterium sp. 13-626]OCJ10495.1 undecaprenyl-diphosphatase UppP [Agrobacterium sp. B131/95]OCJ15338.1 undecaprenyl-diphosphatase UppP [Agrobacterium sp. B133/95]EJK81276.1 undecaprenyl-diphosphatase UppP [Rhizobium sp. AP16]